MKDHFGTKVQDLLSLELATKGLRASLSNAVFGAFIFFHHFSIRTYAFQVKGLASILIFLSFLRFWYSRKYLRNPSKLTGRHLRGIIACFSVTFAVTVAYPFWELNLQGTNFSILVAVVAGFTACSIVTLSYDKLLFQIHSISILGILVVIGVLKGTTGENSQGPVLSIVILLYFFYLYTQYMNFHAQTVDKFRYQCELEASNEEIKTSTSRLIQTSRFEALGEMAQGLAHEINNSTMVILGSAQQVERELRKESILSEKNEKRIHNVVDAVLRMKIVIDGLKFFSQEMEKEDKVPTPLSQIIERTLQYAQEMLRAHDVEFTLEKYDEVIVPCQPIQITHILYNLLKNADEAIKKLNPKDRWIKLVVVNDPRSVCFRVSNGGETIPPEQRKRLFQPFYTTKEVNTGTGLSLSSARGLARDHGGEIFLDEAAEFTTFVLKLPL